MRKIGKIWKYVKLEKRKTNLVLAWFEPTTIESIFQIPRLNHWTMLQLVFEKLELKEYKCTRVRDEFKTKSATRGVHVNWESESERAITPRKPRRGLRLSPRRS
jgi:hypothetical protein